MKVAVVGAGVVGLFAAYYLERGGSEVTVFDPEPPGERSVHAAGILEPTRAYRTNTWAFLRRVVRYYRRGTCVVRGVDPRWLAESLLALGRPAEPGAGRRLAEMAAASLEAYAGLARDADDFGYRRDGLEERYADPVHFAAERATALERADATPVEVRDAPGGGGALVFPDLGWVHTERFVERMVRELSTASFVRAAVEAVAEDGTVVLRGEPRSFDRVVIATGVAARALGLPLTGVRGFGWHLASSRPPERATIYVDRGVAAVPFEHDVKATGGWDFDLSAGTARAASVLDAVRASLPVDKILGFNHGARPCTPDGLPIASRTGPIVIANGGFRLGWSFAPALGLEAARLAQDRAENDPFLARFSSGVRAGRLL